MNVLVPRMSEKAFKLSTDRNTYVFNVPMGMNRTEVSNFIAKEYSVEVHSVKISIAKGKAVRSVRKGGRATSSTRADVKKAYVRLIAGQSLPIFAAVEEEIKAAEDQATKTTEVAEKAKRGIFGLRNQKANKTATAGTTVTRTQAKIGEK